MSQGRVLQMMGPPNGIYTMQEEYKRVKYENFRTKLNSLQKALK
jgi:hypothetical protein